MSVWVFSGYSSFLPQSRDMQIGVRLTEESKFTICWLCCTQVTSPGGSPPLAQCQLGLAPASSATPQRISRVDNGLMVELLHCKNEGPCVDKDQTSKKPTIYRTFIHMRYHPCIRQTSAELRLVCLGLLFMLCSLLSLHLTSYTTRQTRAQRCKPRMNECHWRSALNEG